MIAYLDMYRDQFGVESICATLAQTEGGFNYLTRLPGRQDQALPRRGCCALEVLIPEIQRVHGENYSVYGVRKIWHVLCREGWKIGRDHTARLMRQTGLSGVVRGV